MLGLVLGPSCISLRASQSQARSFTTSNVLQSSRKKNMPTIRTPSKKALAAKARRKAEAAKKLDDRLPKLPLATAIQVLRAVEVANPTATFELFVKTQIGNGVAVPRGRVNLPREAKPKTEDKILVFAEGRLAEDAKRAGAHIVGGPELIDGILSNRIRATTILCTPSLIRTITPKLGRFLGPLGLMPSERRGTVTEDIAAYIQRLRGTSEWRSDSKGSIRAAIATMTFQPNDVEANFRQFMLSVRRATGHAKDPDAPASERKQNAGGGRHITPILNVMLSSSHGPGIRIADWKM